MSARRGPGLFAVFAVNAQLRLRGVRLGRGCWIQSIEIPRNPWDIDLGDEVALDKHVVLLTTGERRTAPRIQIGAGTYVNRFTMFDASDSVVIGKRCMIGPSCYITDHDHGTQAGADIRFQQLRSAQTRIGDDVWISAGVIVLKGVTIANGAIIGARVRSSPRMSRREPLWWEPPTRVIGFRE